MDPVIWKVGSAIGPLLLLYKFVVRRVRHWRNSKASPALDPKSRDWLGLMVGGFVIALALGFAFLLLLTVISQRGESTRLVLLSEAVAALLLFGLLIMVFIAPAYNRIVDLEQRIQQMEKRQEQIFKHQFPLQRELAFMDARYESDAQHTEEDARVPS